MKADRLLFRAFSILVLLALVTVTFSAVYFSIHRRVPITGIDELHRQPPAPRPSREHGRTTRQARRPRGAPWPVRAAPSRLDPASAGFRVPNNMALHHPDGGR